MTKAEPKSVYELLGFRDHESMSVKARLASEISEVIKRRGLTQIQASGLTGIPQPKLSNILRGEFRSVSEAKMLDCLTALGEDVEIVISSAPTSRRGQMRIKRAPKRRIAARGTRQKAVCA